MPDTPLALIRATLAYLKDPLLSKQTLFATAEEYTLFQRRPAAPSRVPIQPLETKPTTWAMREIDPPKKEKLEAKVDNVTSSEPLKITAAKERQPQIKKILQHITPAMQLTDQVLDDAKAKRVANAWKERIPDAEVVLFACDTEIDTLDLLKALAKAIDQNLAKPKLLMADKFEREKRWELFLEKNPLRLIIASAGIENFPECMHFYKTLPASGRFFLSETPLLILSPTSFYKSLEQKALLWKTLCQMLKK